MRILQICSKPPFPPVDGGTLAMNQVTSFFLEFGWSIKVLAFETQKHPVLLEKYTKEYINNTNFESIKIDTSLKLWDAFLNLFSKKSYHLQRFEHKTIETKLEQLLQNEEYDIIWFEGLYATSHLDFIQSRSKAKLVLRAHNVEFLIWERLAHETRSWIKKRYLNLLAARLKRYELQTLNKVDVVYTISTIDKAILSTLQCKAELAVLPFGVDVQQIIEKHIQPKNKIFHLAAMDWPPNLEAVNWFVDEIWPILKTLNKEVAVYLAGRSMPPTLIAKSEERLIITGEVDDPECFMKNHGVMIVPLKSGSGIRIKIAEGLAQGKVIVSTTIGAEGYEVENNKNIIIADHAYDFAEKINLILNNQQFHNEIAENAIKFAEENLNRKKIGITLKSEVIKITAN